MRTLNEGVRALLELIALVSLGYWGWNLDCPLLVRLAAAAFAPMIAATAWAIWVAPKSTSRLDDPFRLGIEVIVFTGATLGLLSTGRRFLGLLFGMIAVGNLIAMAILGQR
ncbi:MAG: YrdB family protein [Acidimicrobiia bacterium]|nr:YrdB family protein [Acidimicrobiia bacterium]